MATLAQIDVMQEGVLFGLPMPMTLRPAKRMSDDELIAFSHRNRPYRIEENSFGELEIMSPLVFDGGQREMYAGAKLFDWAEGYGGVTLSSNVGFRLSDQSVRSPDASWVSANSFASLTNEQKQRFAPICPEFLIEIRSESDSRKVLETKMVMWIEHGAQLAWMIDPFSAEVMIYRPGVAAMLLERPDWVEAKTVVPGFRLEMARLWAK